MAKAKAVVKPSTAQSTGAKKGGVGSTPLSALGVVLSVLGIAIAALAVYLGRNPTFASTLWAKRGVGKTLEAFGRATTASGEIDANLPKGANPEGKPHEVKLGDCKDRHAQCVGFAKNDECVKNPGWMIVNCPRSCNACHLLDPKVRCDRRNLNMSTDPIYKPGDMLDMFQSIEANFGERYKVTVVSTDPYIVTFDDFLTDTEIDALITTVDGGWERSTDTGSANEFGEVGRVLSQGRTSSNAWCRAPCESNPHVQNILKKIGEVTRVPRENYESFQVLRYEIGQAYNPHHDASASQVQLACGPRILTFFLYLSDVEEGGETGFPQFGIKIKPKKGSALLWPSTLNHNPEHIDGRTLHQAHPVVRGTKFAANTWIHLYNFETPNLYGCTGTFSEL